MSGTDLTTIESREMMSVEDIKNAAVHSVIEYKQKRDALIRFARSQLHQGEKAGTGDYNVPYPKAPKKVLLKAGAEKMLGFFQLGCEIRLENQVSDSNTGFFSYIYRARVYPLSMPELTIAEYNGEANTFAKSDWKRDPWAASHMASMMAQKRAFVAAVRIATGMSDEFDQDMDNVMFNKAVESIGLATTAGKLNEVRTWIASVNVFVDADKVELSNEIDKRMGELGIAVDTDPELDALAADLNKLKKIDEGG